MSQQGFQLKLPWWFFVGLIGFFVFGGWRGFFGAIFGVLFLPIALFLGLALIVVLWAVLSGKKIQRFQGPMSQSAVSPQRPRATQDGDIVEAEATVIKRED